MMFDFVVWVIVCCVSFCLLVCLGILLSVY